MRILLVEDEAEMATALSSALRRYDMVVDHAPTLAEAEEAISADVHAAVLLDRQLVQRVHTRRTRRLVFGHWLRPDASVRKT